MGREARLGGVPWDERPRRLPSGEVRAAQTRLSPPPAGPGRTASRPLHRDKTRGLGEQATPRIPGPEHTLREGYFQSSAYLSKRLLSHPGQVGN